MQVELLLLFFAIAAVYAAAGFGGGSSYLAVLALFGVSMVVMRPAALLCNVVVVSGNLFIFLKNNQLRLRACAPLVLAGVPLAFLGGYWKLDERTFFVLLGFSLILAACAMWLQHASRRGIDQTFRPLPPLAGAGLGGSLGFLAGLSGIGGGIFLSPALHLLRWGTAKAIAAASSLFIFCLSLSGLAGQMTRDLTIDWPFILPLLAAVALGGQLGARWSAVRFPQTLVRNLTALLVFYAGANILWRYL